MRPVGIDFFREFHFLSNLRSNGAGLITFVTKQANVADNRYDSALWLWQGAKPRRLAEGELRGTWWCGKDSLVLARPGGEKDQAREKAGLPCTSLRRLPVTGPGEAAEFLKLNMAVEDVACLPDGRMLIVARWDAAVDAALAAAKNDPDKAVAALEKEADYTVLTELPFWENGGGPVSGQRSRLFLWDGKKLRPLTDEKTNVGGLRLSPAGGVATFVANRYQRVAPVEDRLMRLDTHSLEITDITFAEGPFSHHACLPVDEDTLLVCGTNMREFGLNQNPGFYRVAGGSAQPIELSGRYSMWGSVATDLSMAAAPRIYADGQRAFFLTAVDEGSQLMDIELSSGVITQLTHTAGAALELVLDEGTLYFTAMRGLAGPELYRLEPDGGETRLTDFNTSVGEKFTLATPRPLAYTNAAGTEIRGFVLTPEGLEKGGRCPAILDIHGGPKGVYGPVLFHEMQYWAAQGYAVVFCNPTGGDGRGDGFADIRGHYGEVDYTDIMGFLDAALAEYPAIDPARLGVTGGSYGGFMTNWVISHNTRFAAAASQRGISNWLSMATMSDIGYYFEPDQAGTDMWSNPASVLGQSPLKFAHRVKTPTLFIHSEEDYRCPLAEGIQMYDALQTHGVETRMVIFKGENHELSRSGKPLHRIRRLEEITGWMDRYLKQA